MKQSEIHRALTAKPVYDLLNRIDPPGRVMFHCVPMRIIRLIAVDESFKTFRVEQFVSTSKDRDNPRGNWVSLSTHGSPIAGESYSVACKAAIDAQNELRRKMQAQMNKGKIIRATSVEPDQVALDKMGMAS